LKSPLFMLRAPLRRLWLKIHRWIGLTLGPVLALTALLGAVLVVALPIDRQAHPDFFVARSAGDAAAAALPLEPLQQRILAEFGPDTNFTLRPARNPGDTLWVLVRGKWEGTLYLDPATGAEQGRRGTHEGAYNLLFELHSSLLLEDTGKGILACVALSYLFMLVTGVVLWWPTRWPPSLRITLNRGLLRGLFDLLAALAAHHAEPRPAARAVRPAPHGRRSARAVDRGVGLHGGVHGLAAAGQLHLRRCRPGAPQAARGSQGRGNGSPPFAR